VAIMTNKLERQDLSWTIPAEHAPNEKQRAFLENRVAQIDAYVRPASEELALDELVALFAVMRDRNAGQAEEKARMRVYLMDLADVPLSGLRKACAAYRRGETGDGKWLPAPGELRHAALGFVEAYVAERGRLLQILNATILPPTDQEKAAEARRISAAAVRKAWHIPEPGERQKGMHASAGPTPEQIEAEANLNRMRENIPPIKLSPLARASMGMGGTQFEEQADG
jgi:hypothetical protein